MITGIVVALPDELSTLTRKKIEKSHCQFIADSILVVYSGVGPDNAQAATELLIAKGATQLISWGCAAALSPNLKAGDLVLANQLVDAHYNTVPIDPHWLAYARHVLAGIPSLHCGSLAESTRIIASGKLKLGYHHITSAIALDMESVAIAKIASQHRLPFLAVRAIADPANMDLPAAIEFSANPAGDIDLSKLLLFLLLHPLELPRLIKLGLHFNSAKKTLKGVAQHLTDLVAIPKA